MSAFAVELVVERGVSVVARIRAARDGARSFWCAFYGRTVLANGWEPFDQPRAAAYMPFRFADFDRVVLENGTLLAQKRPVSSRAGLHASGTGIATLSQRVARIEDAVALVCANVDVAPRARTQLASALLEHCAPLIEA